MIPPLYKTGLLTRLALLLCVLGSACVQSAPINYGTNVPCGFYHWLDQQPELSSEKSLTITPSGSFIGVGSQLFYTPGINLNKKLEESAWAAGFEVSHTLLLTFVLKTALWLNPIIPIHVPVSFGVDWYRFLRIWRSRLLLGWQLANWGKNAISEAIWPQKKQVLLDLSSVDAGTVIGELDIPTDKTKPIELNIYTDGEIGGAFKECDDLTTFDCLINSQRAAGIHRWQLQWMHDSYEVSQWFYGDTQEPFESPVVSIRGVFNRNTSEDGAVHDIAGILSALFSSSLLESALNQFNPLQADTHLSEKDHWSGNHSAFISLGCPSEARCSGLYVAEGITSENVSVKRMVVDTDTVSREFFESFDYPHTGTIISRSTRLYRIPESAVTVAFEILEELIEELGYQALESISVSSSMPTAGLQEKASEEDESCIQDTSDIEPANGHRYSLFSEEFDRLIAKGQTTSIPRLKFLAGSLDEETVRQGFTRAIKLNRLDMAEQLLSYLPDSWINFYLKQVVRRPDDLKLHRIIQFLPEKHILPAMKEATNYGLFRAVELLNTFASEATRDEVLLQAAYRGRVEIVQVLLPGRSQGLLQLALNRAHHSGFVATRDLIFDHLDTTTIKHMLKPDVFKERLIRALESDDMERVKELIALFPPELSDIMPALLIRYSSEHAKRDLAAQMAGRTSSKSELVKAGNDLSALLKIAQGMTDFGRELLLEDLITSNKISLLPVIFSTLSSERKVTWLLEQAQKGEGAHLHILMISADLVIRDQVLLESVRTMRPQEAIIRLAEYSEQPSIRRAAIYAAKSGLPEETKLLERLLPPEPPIYHLTVEEKVQKKRELRVARNRRLGRRELGEKYYVYMHGEPARMLYVTAHGDECSKTEPFKHTGNYQLGFIAPDGHMLKTNHIEAYLERHFVPAEIIPQGQNVKEYSLTKNYNSGWAFKRMHSHCGKHNSDLMERKAAPAVISEVRRYFAKTSQSVDFLTIRGKGATHLSDLLYEVNQAKWAAYSQVIVGCCRGAGDDAPVYSLPRLLTTNYLTYAPDIFMKVSNYLKVHPAFWDSPVWENYHPDTAPEIWLKSLESHRDEMVRFARGTFKEAAEIAERNSAKLPSKAPRHL